MSKSSQEKPSWQKSKYWTYNTTNLSYHFKCVQRRKSCLKKKKLKENMKTVFHQIKNINNEIEMMLKNKIGILV